MPKRSSKPKDVNLLAVSIVEGATIETQTEEQAKREKNPAAVMLGRLGGKKGGLARADKLTAARRSEIARKAALTRWRKGQ